MSCQSLNHRFQEELRIHWERREGRALTEDGEVFFFHCPGCEKVFCHICEGGADDMPEHCDTCWCEVFHGAGLWAWIRRIYYRTVRGLAGFWWVARLRA